MEHTLLDKKKGTGCGEAELLVRRRVKVMVRNIGEDAVMSALLLVVNHFEYLALLYYTSLSACKRQESVMPTI